jgi:hypothetical protein
MGLSFHEISIAIRAENRATGAFRSLALDIANLGAATGLLTNEQVKAVSVFFTVVRVVESMKVVLGAASLANMAHAASSHIAAAATWVLNASLAMKISLLTLGVGLIAVTAGYMAWLASTTRDAAAAQSEYNEQIARSPRGIRRLGEEQSLISRGVEY